MAGRHPPYDPGGTRQHSSPKRNRKDPICFSPYLYRARNLVERFFNEIKQCRRVATRYDKLAANHLAFIKLASIRIWLRANEFHTLVIPAEGSSCRIAKSDSLRAGKILPDGSAEPMP